MKWAKGNLFIFFEMNNNNEVQYTKEQLNIIKKRRNLKSDYIIMFKKDICSIRFKERSFFNIGNTSGRLKQGCIRILFVGLDTAAMKASDLVLNRNSLL